METLKKLANRIKAFIEKYAAISPNWDEKSEDSKFTGPDPYQLLYVAECFLKQQSPGRCWSEWGSGCYKPYSSREGRQEHDEIMKEVNRIINSLNQK